MEGKKSLTATNLAEHQHRNCDLYIHNIYNRASHGYYTSPASPSELAKALFKRGNDWEAVLYSWLDDSRLLLKVPAVPLQADSLLENILADERTHFFITGLCFWPPQVQLTDRFVQAGSEPLKFGLAKPDLVEIKRTNDGIQWRVIDAKASKGVKVSHHMQIYFYTLCLSHILQPPFYHAAGSAGIWLPPRDGFQISPPSITDINSMSVSLLAPAFDAYLFRELPQVISLPFEKVNWHYNPLCRVCRYEPDCKSRAVMENKLGMMPNVSIDDAKVLNDLLRASRATPPLTDIEELHELMMNPTKLEQIAKTSPTVLRKAKQILLLPKRKKGILTSPAVEAAQTRKIQVVSRRNYTCPRCEDIGVVISIVNDPSSPNAGGDYFCITTHSDLALPPSICCPASQFIRKLASVIRTITAHRRTCQFYVWTSTEQLQLQTHIIYAALAPAGNDDDDIRLCIGALAQGASLLQTTFQPLLLSGALLTFLGKGKQTKAEYIACLARMGLPTDGTVEALRKRVDAEVRRIQDAAAAMPAHEQRRKEIGQLSKVVALKKEIERQLALPIPGYWDLPECVSIMLPSEGVCPTDEEIFSAYKNGDQGDALDTLLLRRNHLIYSVLKNFRSRVVTASQQSLCVNEAKILSTSVMDLCKEPHIRKLFFMQQFEVLAKLTELWQSRIDGCPGAPTLEYSHVVQSTNGPKYIFRLVSGEVDVPAVDKDWALYDKLLVRDIAKSTDLESNSEDVLPVEALFDDLGVSGLVFPLARWAMPTWGQQDPRVQRELVVADVRNVFMEKGKHSTMVALRIWPGGKWNNTVLKVGDIYRLSPRLVDFNTSKILSSLFECDLQWESEGTLWADEDEDGDDMHRDVPFLQLITAPASFGKIHDAKKYVKTEAEIQKLFRDLKSLGNDVAGSLVLKASQHRAAQRILSNRLSIIWGPPGTGKTYTISLSLLRLLEVERRHCGEVRKIIFITAFTHSAIEACRSKLVKLMEAYRSIESLPLKWLDDVQIDVVSRGSDHPAPPKSGSGIRIYAGTLFQLSNFTKRHNMQVDCVIVDEAGQISLGAISLVLRSLTMHGRIIIAGDSEQLAPILSAQYPQSKSGSLFGSVLDCLMFAHLSPFREKSQILSGSQEEADAPASQNTVVQLTENFRLNPDLGEFVSTIYARQFKPQKVQARKLAEALKSLSGSNSEMDIGNPTISCEVQTFLVALSAVMSKQPQTVLVAPKIHSIAPIISPGAPVDVSLAHLPVSLSLIRLQTWSSHTEHVGNESHVQGEAAVAASLVKLLQRCSPHEDIFVATPHRIQREAVNTALAQLEVKKEAGAEFQRFSSGSTVTVDTIERLQGSEADFVICLFSLPRASTTDLSFLLERRRLNVAISRAKTLCILVTSDEVLCPSVKVLADAEIAKGFAFLKDYEKRAWSYKLPLNIDKFSSSRN